MANLYDQDAYTLFEILATSERYGRDKRLTIFLKWLTGFLYLDQECGREY